VADIAAVALVEDAHFVYEYNVVIASQPAADAEVDERHREEDAARELREGAGQLLKRSGHAHFCHLFRIAYYRKGTRTIQLDTNIWN
jgi:hypothetical protein